MTYRTTTNSYKTACFTKMTVTRSKWIPDLRHKPGFQLMIEPYIKPCRSIFVVGQTETTIELLLVASGYRHFIPGLDDTQSVDRYLHELSLEPATMPKTERDPLTYSEAMTLLDQAREFMDSEKYLKDFLNLLDDRCYEPLHAYEDDPPYRLHYPVYEAITEPIHGVIQINMNGSDPDVLGRIVSTIIHRYNNIYSHGSTAHYRLTISDTVTLSELNKAFSDEFITKVKHHLLIIDYSAEMSSSFQSIFEQTYLVPFLKVILQHEKVLLINHKQARFNTDELPISTFQFYSGIA